MTDSGKFSYKYVGFKIPQMKASHEEIQSVTEHIGLTEEEKYTDLVIVSI